MSVVLLALGVVVLLLTVHDFLATTTSVGTGKGPLTTHVAEGVWRAAKTTGSSRLVRWAGPAVIVLVLTVWMAMSILGWTLVLRPELTGWPTGSLLDRPLAVLDHLMGNGAAPQDASTFGRLAVRALDLYGLGILTLSLAFVLPVVSSVTEKRRTAARLSALGPTSQGIVRLAWNGEGFGDLHLHLIALVDDLGELTQRYQAYPILHYFHSDETYTSLPARLAVVDDALSLLLGPVTTDRSLPMATVEAARAAVTHFLETLHENFVRAAAEPPPPPAVDELEAAGLLDADVDITACFDAIADRRRFLLGYVHDDAGAWSDREDVQHPAADGATLVDEDAHA